MADMRRQHYVPKSYLDAWATEGKLWVYRGNSISHIATNKAAVKTWCYEIQPLNAAEQRMFVDFLKMLPYISQDLIDLFLELSEYGALTAEERRVWFERRLGACESKFIPIRKSLMEDDYSVFESMENIVTVVFYLVLQYYRTLSYEELVKRQRFVDLSVEQINKFMGYIRFAMACSDTNDLLNNLDVLRLAVFKNDEHHEFLTGDNPFVTLESNETCVLSYFPLSPERAMILASNVDLRVENGTVMRQDEVRKYNRLLAEQCLHEIYAFSEDALNRLKSEVSR